MFFFREVLRSAIVILQSIPSIAWVPLFLIVMGFGSTPIIVVVALSAFFPAALSVMNATESVQRVHVSAARVMGATRLEPGQARVPAGRHARAHHRRRSSPSATPGAR